MATKQKCRAFLKWAGGKYNLVQSISAHLPDSSVLIEPFVGAGSVFLNTDYPRYHLNDINADLIGLYQLLKTEHSRFIADAPLTYSSETRKMSMNIRFSRTKFSGKCYFCVNLIRLNLNKVKLVWTNV